MIPLGDIDPGKGGDPPTPGFVKSVRKRMRQPILVEDTGRKKGRYRIVDGRRRFYAVKEFAKDDGITEIAAVLDEGASDLTPITMNALRSDNVIDSARRVWAKLDKGLSDKDIALEAADGIAEIAKQLLPTVRGLRDMRKLLPELIEAVEKRKMSPWSARMAARQPDNVTPDDVVAARRHKQIEAAAADEIVDAIESAPDDTGENLDDEEGELPADEAEFDAFEDGEDSPYEGATSNGQPSIAPEQRKASAIRLLTAAAKELGFTIGVWPESEDCVGLIEDVISTLNDLS
jgi:ParB-like chromosome segregation protein Spo0J